MLQAIRKWLSDNEVVWQDWDIIAIDDHCWKDKCRHMFFGICYKTVITEECDYSAWEDYYSDPE